MSTPALELPVSRIASLLASIGKRDPNAFAGEVLRTLDPLIGAAQCTVFAYEFSNRPRTVSVADHRGGNFLSDVADHYTRLYYALDGNQKVLADATQSAPILHRQRREEIAHDGYRMTCYERPNVGDRISLLTPSEPGIWLAINLYRDQQQGQFSPIQVNFLEEMAPVLAHAARYHYALGSHPGVSPLARSRLRQAGPELTGREFDALCGVLDGKTAQEIGEQMGVAASSVVTYQKRGYRRLGISTQRELFALTSKT